MSRTGLAPGGAIWPLTSLVIANLIPLAGVHLWGWNLTDLLILYWLENAVVGLFTVFSLLAARPEGAPSLQLIVGKVFLVPFFVMHYGIFWVGHGMFLMTFFGGESGGIFSGAAGGSFAIASQTSNFFLAPLQATLAHADLLFWPLAVMLVSHGVAFITDFLATGEYRTASVGETMMRPYGRVVVLHLTIVFGGFLAMAMGPSRAVLLLFVLVKLVADVASYLRVRPAKLTRVRWNAGVVGKPDQA